MVVLHKLIHCELFMKLTLDEAIQKGVESHKAGVAQIQQADILYTAILKVQPKHPDANHNLGVLAVNLGKVQEALPFFRAALEANSTISQFWLSYIDALIKLGCLDDAQIVFTQAKNKGANGDEFDELEQQLSKRTLKENQPDTREKAGTITCEPNILGSVELDRALKLAKQKSIEGRLEEARSIYEDILQKFPDSLLNKTH